MNRSAMALKCWEEWSEPYNHELFTMPSLERFIMMFNDKHGTDLTETDLKPWAVFQ